MSMIRVLYVDDEPDLLDVGKLFIEQFKDISVDTAISAHQALDRLQQATFDAIVSDYMMPEMDGIALLKNIRHINRTIPFILFTGKGREEVVIEALNSGADFYLQKGGLPRVQYTELVHKIRQAVQRRRAEEALRESEKRYRNVVEDQTEFISRFAPDGTHLFANDAYCRYFNKQREEIIGNVFTPHIFTEDQARVSEHFLALTQDHPVALIEHRIIMPDGKIRWQRWSDRAVFDSRGRIVEYQSVGQDITEQRAVEEALRKSETLFRSIVQNSSDIFSFLDAGGVITYESPATGRVLGYVAGERVGKNIFDFVHPDDIPVVKEVFVQSTHKPGATIPPQFRCRHKDGSWVWLEAVSSNYLDDPNIGAIIVSSRDITLRRDAAKALQDSEERYRAMIQAMNSGIAVYQPVDLGSDFVFKDFNPAAERITHATREQVLGRRMLEAFPNMDKFGLLLSLQRVYRTGAPEYLPAAYYKDQHREGWRENFIYRLPSGDIVAIFNDVTERKKAEEALRESEEFNRSLVENLPDYIMVYDNKGTIVYMNSSAARAMGCPAEDLIGTSVLSSVAPYHREMAEGNIRKRIAGHEVEPYEIDTLTKHGQVITTMLRAQPIVYHHEPGFLLVLTDITERKQAEQQIQESQRVYTTLIQNLPGIAYRCHNDPNRTMAFISDGCHELTGYPPTDLLQNKKLAFNDLILPDHQQRIWNKWQSVLAQKVPFEDEYPIITSQEDVKWVWEKGCGVFSLSGELLYLEGFISDITDRRRVEDALKQVNKKLNILSSITRHDILNKVTVLRGYVEIARDSPTSSMLPEYLRRIDEAAKVIREQIAFTKDYQNLGIAIPAWQELDGVFKKSVSGFDLAQKTVIVETNGFEVYADPLLERVFYNLIDNSLTHGATTTRISFKAHESDNHLIITYKDNGAGILEKDKAKIFDHGVGRHSGLGLYLVREILSITDITIQETGEPNKGVRFTLTVPKGAFRIKGKGAAG
jgi:PAS domain S-box-containing protein